MDHSNASGGASFREHYIPPYMPPVSAGVSTVPTVQLAAVPTVQHGHVSSLLLRISALSFLSLLVWAAYRLLVRNHLSPIRHLPSPDQGFVLFRLLHEPKVTELEAWIDTVAHDGLIRYFGLWNEERVFVASPDAVEDVLVKQPYCYTKPKLQYVLADNVASKGLLIQEGDVHKAARKSFNPAFSSDRIRRLYPIVLRGAIQLLDKVEEQTKRDSHDKPAGHASILKPVSAVAIDTIGHWGYSRAINALVEPREFGKAYIEMFKTTRHGQMTLDAAAKMGPELALKLPLRAVRTIRSVMDLVRRTSDDIVAEHELDGNGADDMLTTVMKTDRLSHTELVDQTVHFFAAATETVSGSIAWTIHLLSRHPPVQARLRDEIHRQLPSRAALLADETPSVLDGMPYLNAVIKEVLRFHSVNTILWRECVSADAAISGHRVPVGTKIAFSPWALNRNPAYWGADARRFDPDRWMADPVSGGADRRYSFLTFGAGPRRCIGEAYARAEMRCIVAALVGAFEWAPTDELQGDAGSDDGEEIGDNHALTLFKILDGWRVKCSKVPAW